ncbi:MAG: hypothetical protein ABSE59_11525 [Opitutaceae bacterium]|jgi:hypothetical protein
MNNLTVSESFDQLTLRHRSLAGLLELILCSCELSPDQHLAIRRHHAEKIDHLKECHWLQQFDLHIGLQGSAALGTSVAPLERKHGEYDIDLLLKVMARATAFTPAELHRRIGEGLRTRYKDIMYAIRYGWQLDYAANERFHFDIIGAIPCVHAGRPMVAVCDSKTSRWKESNSEDYIREFLETADQLPLIEDMGYRNMLEGRMVLANCARSVEVDPLPENTALKMPLQRGVQFSKRHRDVWFSNRKALDRRTPSIVLTTILWRVYEREVINKTFPSIFSVLETMVEHLDDPKILVVSVDHNFTPRYFLENPTVPGENLVARWNEPERGYEAKEFYQWVKDYKAFVRTLSKTEGLFQLEPLLEDALGKDTVEPVFKRTVAALQPTPTRPAINYGATLGITTSAISASTPIRSHTFHGRP